MLTPFPGTVDFAKWEQKAVDIDGRRRAADALLAHPAVEAAEGVLAAPDDDGGADPAGTQRVWDRFYSLPAIWQRSSCVRSVRARLAFVLISKLYRQMYANTGIATDSARVARSARRARLLAGGRAASLQRPCRPMPDLNPECTWVAVTRRAEPLVGAPLAGAREGGACPALTRGRIRRQGRRPPSRVALRRAKGGPPSRVALRRAGKARPYGDSSAPGISSAWQVTQPGTVAGTLAYMAPEQALGEDVDARADLFALGVVLYEMAGGVQPFAAPTANATVDRVIHADPPPLLRVNPRVPPALEAIVGKALEKDRRFRYQSAAEMRADLERFRRPSAASAPAQSPDGPAADRSRSLLARRWPLGLAAAAVVAAVALAWPFRQAQALGESDVIVLLDFVNTTGDGAFDGTLKQALAVKLEESPFLNLLPDARIQDTLRQMQHPPDAPLTPDVGREICERQSLKATIGGEVAQLGSLYVVTLSAVECLTGAVLAREQAEASGKERVLAAVGGAATRLRRRLGESLASIARTDTPIEQGTTGSLEALRLFTRGEQLSSRGDRQAAIPFYRQAIDLDPDFALAHARLGAVYFDVWEHARALDHFQRAFDLRDRVSQREHFHVTSSYYLLSGRDPERARETYDVWIATYPRDPFPHNSLGNLYSQLGEPEKALASYLEAIRLAPESSTAYSNAIARYRALNRFDEARALLDRAEAILGATPLLRIARFHQALAQRDMRTANEEARALAGTAAAPIAMLAQMRYAYMQGRLAEGRALARQLVELADARGLTETAGLAATFESYTRLQLGDAEGACTQARAALSRYEAPHARGIAGIVLARCGDPAVADTIADDMDRRFPERLGMMAVYRTALRAGAARARGDANAALEILTEAERYEMTDGNGPELALMRGETLLAIGDADGAAAAFRKILDAPGAQPLAYEPPALIGLARALAARGDVAGARAAYEELFEYWKDAEPGVPALQRAREEYARLGTIE
jgi:eukaryotic-like serine/threonine-protein kinase